MNSIKLRLILLINYDFLVPTRVGDDVRLNIPAGHIIKTKSPSTDEGGVGHGAAALDTPLLVPDSQYIHYLKRCNEMND